MTDAGLRDLALKSRAWPFEEARKLVERLKRRSAPVKEVLFETGYGPSGLPHIGTFGEVARTTMVRHAFETMSDVPTRILCFSDDMDGLRKVPDNVPTDKVNMYEYVEVKTDDGLVKRPGTPLTSIPDPFGTHASYGEHNNARLRKFLDDFGFEYEFASATEYYRSGRFDEALIKALTLYRDICAIVLPTLRQERRLSYSPFLPITEYAQSRRVVLHHAVITEARPHKGTALFQPVNTVTGEPDGPAFEHLVTGGHCKLQWRADWAMRWFALSVDYEMSGKDLIDSVKLASRICSVLGGEPPEGFNYELFLDEKGQKISKSKGNGLTIEEWLAYASPESLELFMYNRPREAKRLYFDVIPRHVDEYYAHIAAYPRQDEAQKLSNPVWHIHGGNPPEIEMPVSYSLLLNLATVANAHSKDVLWGFLKLHVPGVSPETHPELDRLVGYALRYYEDFVLPAKRYRAPDEVERAALLALSDKLAGLPEDASPAEVQTVLYDVGRAVPRYQDLGAKGATAEKPGVSGAWFNAIYQVLLGEERGPRFGSFVALYGIANTRALIAKALEGKLAA